MNASFPIPPQNILVLTGTRQVELFGWVIVPGRAPSPFQHEHDASHTTTSSIAPLFGAFDQVSSPKFLAALPIAPWEFSLGVWMVVKGFRPSTATSDETSELHLGFEPEI